MITSNAKNIINQIAKEVRLADLRRGEGFIKQAQVEGAILEGLSALGKRDVDMKTFLTTMSYIPPEDDYDDDREWAEDRRDQRTNVVTDREQEYNHEFPTPGERVC